MRVFYSINFDKETTDTLKALQQDLKTHVRGGRWAELENLHLTLHFIGEIDERSLPRLKEAMNKAAEGVSPFNIKFTSYGSFRQGKQDLIYIKTKSEGRSLDKIAARLKEITAEGDMKEFTPHITMIRRAEMNYKTLKILKKQRFSLPAVKISSIELMESRKVDGRLVYTPLHTCSLT